MSYRLEEPRHRPPPLKNIPPPPPLAGHSPEEGSPSDGQALLRDLPSPSIVATSPRMQRFGMRSPTSPTSRAGRRARTKSPPGSRALNDAGLKGDLEEFATQCRAWYYQQDDKAGRTMTQTLATLPPSQRALFARLQAQIRSQYHHHVAVQRQAEYAAHLSSITPGHSLSAACRLDWHGEEARKTRLDKFERFVGRWCTPGMPGTKAFFEGLWAVMRLEVIPDSLGGAGQRRIEWEVDDAVFKESSGKDFMFEAVDVLKGVLAFEDRPSAKRAPTWSRPGSMYNPSGLPQQLQQQLQSPHARSQSQPLASASAGPPAIATTTRWRQRAPSDPFLDTPLVPLSQSTGSTSSLGHPAPSLLTSRTDSGGDDPPSSAMPDTPNELDEDPMAAMTAANVVVAQVAIEEADESEGYMRIWTAPDLSDPEYLELLKVFPAFVTKRTLPRFPISGSSPPPSQPVDVEEGMPEPEYEHGDKIAVRCGTGSMWVGSQLRSKNYRGGWWTRFVGWWRRLFC